MYSVGSYFPQGFMAFNRKANLTRNFKIRGKGKVSHWRGARGGEGEREEGRGDKDTDKRTDRKAVGTVGELRDSSFVRNFCTTPHHSANIITLPAGTTVSTHSVCFFKFGTNIVKRSFCSMSVRGVHARSPCCVCVRTCTCICACVCAQRCACVGVCVRLCLCMSE